MGHRNLRIVEDRVLEILTPDPQNNPVATCQLVGFSVHSCRQGERIALLTFNEHRDGIADMSQAKAFTSFASDKSARTMGGNDGFAISSIEIFGTLIVTEKVERMQCEL